MALIEEFCYSNVLRKWEMTDLDAPMFCFATRGWTQYLLLCIRQKLILLLMNQIYDLSHVKPSLEAQDLILRLKEALHRPHTHHRQHQ